MEKENVLIVRTPDPKNCACYYCKNGLWGAGDSSCMKYKLKPSEVLYENMKCPKYEGTKTKKFKSFANFGKNK